MLTDNYKTLFMIISPYIYFKACLGRSKQIEYKHGIPIFIELTVAWLKYHGDALR